MQIFGALSCIGPFSYVLCLSHSSCFSSLYSRLCLFNSVRLMDSTVLKVPLVRKLGWLCDLIYFPFLRCHSPLLPIVWCLKIVVFCILSSFSLFITGGYFWILLFPHDWKRKSLSKLGMVVLICVRLYFGSEVLRYQESSQMVSPSLYLLLVSALFLTSCWRWDS